MENCICLGSKMTMLSNGWYPLTQKQMPVLEQTKLMRARVRDRSHWPIVAPEVGYANRRRVWTHLLAEGGVRPVEKARAKRVASHPVT